MLPRRLKMFRSVGMAIGALGCGLNALSTPFTDALLRAVLCREPCVDRLRDVPGRLSGPSSGMNSLSSFSPPPAFLLRLRASSDSTSLSPMCIVRSLNSDSAPPFFTPFSADFAAPLRPSSPELSLPLESDESARAGSLPPSAVADCRRR